MSLVIDIGDVFVEAGGDILSDAIEELTGSEVSHCGVVTDACDGGDGTNCDNYEHCQVTQALSQGIVTISLADSLKGAKQGWILHDPTLTPDDRQKIVQYADGKQGQPYAYADLALEFLDIISGNPAWSIFGDAAGALICSQFAALAYLAAGRDFGLSPRVVKPSDVMAYAQRSGWLIQAL